MLHVIEKIMKNKNTLAVYGFIVVFASVTIMDKLRFSLQK